MEKIPKLSVNTLNWKVNKVLNKWRLSYLQKLVLFLFLFHWLAQALGSVNSARYRLRRFAARYYTSYLTFGESGDPVVYYILAHWRFI